MNNKNTTKQPHKSFISFFHELIVDISKLISNDEDTQENIQMGTYVTIGMASGLIVYNDQKKHAPER